MKYKRLWILSTLLLVLILAESALFFYKITKKTQDPIPTIQAGNSQTQETGTLTAETKATPAEVKDEMTGTEPDMQNFDDQSSALSWTQMCQEIQRQMQENFLSNTHNLEIYQRENRGNRQVYLQNLNRQEEILDQTAEGSMNVGNMTDLFLADWTFEQIREGTWSDQENIEAETQVQLLLTSKDETARGALTERAIQNKSSFEAYKEKAENQYTDTQIETKSSSAKDIGKVLKKIWTSEAIGFEKLRAWILEEKQKNQQDDAAFSFYAWTQEADGTQYYHCAEIFETSLYSYVICTIAYDVANIEQTKKENEEIFHTANRYFANSALQEETDQTQDTEQIPQSQIEQLIAEKISAYDGEWSVYLKTKGMSQEEVCDLYPEESGRTMKSASLIKLFVMETLYDRVQQDVLQSEAIEGLIQPMITVSDNEACNTLVTDFLGDGDADHGMAEVTWYAQQNGYTDTSMGRLMLSYQTDGDNYTSARDCGTLLEKIYDGTCVSEADSQKMLSFLQNQERRNKIPYGLQMRWTGTEEWVANKTGEIAYAEVPEKGMVEGDVAIVHTSFGDYILCILVNDMESNTDTQTRIQDLSGWIYDYLAAENE